MTNQPQVSVLMPVLNEEAGVAGAIASALDQSDHGIEVEVLVVNGPSTDATAEIVSGIAAGDPRVRLLDNPLRSIPAGLNIGLAAARGEFVARIDGHASVSPDYIARGISHLTSEPELAAVGGIRIGVARTPQGRAVCLALASPFGVGNSINHFGTEYCYTDHASFGVYRTAVARAVGGWDETLLVNEDVDFDHRILALGHRISFDPDMHIYWHVRENVPDLFRQYRRYGRGKAAMVRKNGRGGMRARHLAAPTAVAGTAGLALVATKFPRLAAAAYAPYLLGVGAASAHAWNRRADTLRDPRDRRPTETAAGGEQRTVRQGQGATGSSDGADAVDIASIPGAFMAMHYGWGLGFLEGFVLGRTPAQSSARIPAQSAPAAS